MASPAELQTTETIGAEALFRAHASFVAGFLVRLGVRPADLDDLMQEVFVVAHRRGGVSPRAPRPPPPPPPLPSPGAVGPPPNPVCPRGGRDQDALVFPLGAHPRPPAP